ncbi:hypothetical protein [Bacillus glycinifermentans]|uniref:Uncharacterized protein n=1 Tax=Bacillus glycinifermentans TaxID=1664069 RepID=A0A0T6BNV1_9BACI|nr:hypothetical protein [Bacillus glycinifermentans]ATH95117.1 hypothetical protein COP00_23155 [Bacillus glycinifermentans]KRT93307.1 hypothetical protein AB447_220400 [Bacillus glycinifermentans]MEC0487509.1 hypothetical protein [Bacillus glycinifermentans]UOY88618.1 hypothetical protein MW696_21910 [Bacillus glycinifermentans]
MNFQWITTLFRNRDLIGRRRNRGAMWMSLLGLGISLAAYLFRRNGNKNKQQNNLPNVASALTSEFSNELKPNQNAFNTKKN